MPGRLALRPARSADDPALVAIRRDAILTLSTADMGDERARAWAGSAADDRVLRAIERHQVWVAERDGVALGWVEIDADRIEGLYVRPDVAREGVGSALLAHAEERIRAAGHASAKLDASPNAEEFYLRYGFQFLSEPSVDEARPMSKRLRVGSLA